MKMGNAAMAEWARGDIEFSGWNRRDDRGRIAIPVMTLLLLLSPLGWAAESNREQAVKIVTQIQRADYEGDRAALKRLYGELAPFADDQKLGSRIHYWRGF